MISNNTIVTEKKEQYTNILAWIKNLTKFFIVSVLVNITTDIYAQNTNDNNPKPRIENIDIELDSLAHILPISKERLSTHQTLLELNINNITEIANCKECIDFFSKLLAQNNSLYYQNLEKLLVYYPSFIKLLSETHNNIQYIQRHWLTIENLSDLIENNDPISLKEYLFTLKFWSQIRQQLEKIYNHQHQTNLAQWTHNIQKNEMRTIYRFVNEVLEDTKNNSTIKQISKTQNSISYVNITWVWVWYFLCGHYSNIQNKRMQEKKFPDLQFQSFVHITPQLSQNDFAFHMAELIDLSLHNSSSEHNSILINCFPVFDQLSNSNNWTELLVQDPLAQYNLNSELQWLQKANITTIKKIIQKSNTLKKIINADANHINILCENDRVVTVYVNLLPLDLDRNDEDWDNNYKQLENACLSINPEILISIWVDKKKYLDQTKYEWLEEFRYEYGPSKISEQYLHNWAPSDKKERTVFWPTNEKLLDILKKL